MAVEITDIQLGLMKLLSTKHFPLRSPRPKVKLAKLIKAMDRIGTQATVDELFTDMTTLKGRGYVNTEPKIIMKDEIETCEFEVWLTPLGRSELQRKLAG